jgi:branched-chain amino acid transport system ATP-binding protein
VFAKIKEINDKHKTAILVVEHNIKSLLDIADRGYVLDNGRVATGDASQRILESGILEKIFLG